MELLGTLYHHCFYENLADAPADASVVNNALSLHLQRLDRSPEMPLITGDGMRSPLSPSHPQGLDSLHGWRQKMVAIAALASISVTSTSPVLGQTTPSSRCTVCLRYGDQGVQVVYIQDQLKTLGLFGATSTGYFGPLTETAVRQFQQNYGLTVDGIIGPQTQGRLDQIIYGGIAPFSSPSPPSRSTPSISTPSSTPRPSSTIRPGQIGTELYIGSESSQVRDVQDRLQRAGFYQGRLTGYYGSLTSSAVATFQSSQGMEPTGITGQKTLNALINVAP